MSGVLLLQLPLHPGTAWEATGNIPLAPAKLAAQAGLPRDSVMGEEKLNTLGDRALLEEMKERDPEVIGVTLYLWNRARTAHLLREYRKVSPEVLVVAGGPEVTGDNESLLREGCIDLFVAGEGESFAFEVLGRRSLRNLIKEGKRLLGPFKDTSHPYRWADPYETGHIAPREGGSAHVETQRGCGCLCSYCAYRRTSPVPRIAPADKALERIRHLRELGARELVFLDPTFNARPDLEELLQGMRGLGLKNFAEVRGDLLRAGQGRMLMNAGFESLEVGLQTMSAQVLKAVGRGGNPESILQGARQLKEAGITPVMDLILGLPGDGTENIQRAAEEMVRLGISDQVQTFVLSVLPGTGLRASASQLGIQYMDTPPYCVTRSGEYSLQDLLDAREMVSDTLGYDADPPPRPVLCERFPGMERFSPESPSSSPSPSVRHGVLRIETKDSWKHRNSILNKIRSRRSIDPFCPLDIVIESAALFPLDLLDMIGEMGEPESYDREKATIYPVPSLIRTAVVAPENADPEWLMECSGLAVTVVRASAPVPSPGGETGLLLSGSHDLSQLSARYAAIPHLIFFDDPELERLWNLDVLGLG